VLDGLASFAWAGVAARASHHLRGGAVPGPCPLSDSSRGRRMGRLSSPATWLVLAAALVWGREVVAGRSDFHYLDGSSKPWYSELGRRARVLVRQARREKTTHECVRDETTSGPPGRAQGGKIGCDIRCLQPAGRWSGGVLPEAQQGHFVSRWDDDLPGHCLLGTRWAFGRSRKSDTEAGRPRLVNIPRSLGGDEDPRTFQEPVRTSWHIEGAPSNPQT